jgi:hypothetical protein
VTDTPAQQRVQNAPPAIRARYPGRPKGARHKVTLTAEALLDGEAEGLPRKARWAATPQHYAS